MMFLTMLVLTGFGIVAVWSAVGTPAPLSINEGTKQALFSVIGVLLMLVAASIDYRYLKSAAWLLYAGGILSLLAVLSPLGYAPPGTGAQNWINLGVTTIQPSEFTKITTIIALSAFISSREEGMKDLGNFIMAGLIVALPTGLILLGPDLGQTMIYLALWASVLLVTRTRTRFLVAIAMALPAMILFAWKFILQDYQRQRILLSYNPGSAPQAGGYQIIQARAACWGRGCMAAPRAP